MKTALNLLPSRWQAVGLERAEQQVFLLSFSWVESRFHPHPEARAEERGLCIKAKHQTQLSGVFLLTIQGKMTAPSLNYFLARHFIKIELDFCGWEYNYCPHPVRV